MISTFTIFSNILTKVSKTVDRVRRTPKVNLVLTVFLILTIFGTIKTKNKRIRVVQCLVIYLETFSVKVPPHQIHLVIKHFIQNIMRLTTPFIIWNIIQVTILRSVRQLQRNLEIQSQLTRSAANDWLAFEIRCGAKEKNICAIWGCLASIQKLF